MTLAFDVPECLPSFVQRLDPRWKLAGVLLAALAFTLLVHVGPALAALGGALVLVGLARPPIPRDSQALGTPVAMFGRVLILLPRVCGGGLRGRVLAR